MINYLKSMVYTLSIILISTIIITIFNYFNILNGIVLKVIMLLIPIIGIFVGSFKIGKVSSKKGYIEGIKYSIIWIVIFLIINILAKDIKLNDIIYFLLIILTSTSASMLGINRKK